MGDERARERERRVKGGTEADEAARLGEDCRSGRLHPARLRLAAYLRHRPAGLALGADAPTPPDDLDDWLRGLGPIAADLEDEGHLLAQVMLVIVRCGGGLSPVDEAIVEDLERASRAPSDPALLDHIDVDLISGASGIAFELLQLPASGEGVVERLVDGVAEATLGLSNDEWVHVRSSLEGTLLRWALAPLDGGTAANARGRE